MAITINWDAREIFIPKSDLTLIQSVPTEIREIDLDFLRLTLKSLEDDETGMLFPATHNHVAPIAVGGVSLARVVELINDYTITFEDGNYAVNIVGGNSNVGDRVNVNQVSVRSANSAGLVQSSEIEFSSFQNAVWLNQANGSIGTLYPKGTAMQPVNSLLDAQLIASLRGFNTFRILGMYTSLGTEIQNGGHFLGSNLNYDRIMITPGTQIVGGQYEKLWIKGDAMGGTFQECFIEDCMTLLGGAKDCGFLGTCSFINAPPNVFQFFDCHVTNSDNPIATLNFIPSITVLMHRCSGRWLLRNVTAGVHVLNMAGAEIDLDSSCTGGTVIVRGSALITGAPAGTTVVDATGVFDDPNASIEKILKLSKLTFARS